MQKLDIRGLVSIGGDGSLSIGQQLFEGGVPLVGVPKTIDNDLEGTLFTFGFDSAVACATDALDRLHTTAESHNRVMVLEVMGRYAGWIALYAGVAGGADVILIPEIPFTYESICEQIQRREKMGKHFTLVIVAEGAREKGGEFVTAADQVANREARLGGIAAVVAAEVEKRTGKEARACVLGHLQRGGCPTNFDRALCSIFGAEAVELIAAGKYGQMVAYHGSDVSAVPIAEAVGRLKTVQPTGRFHPHGPGTGDLPRGLSGIRFGWHALKGVANRPITPFARAQGVPPLPGFHWGIVSQALRACGRALARRCREAANFRRRSLSDGQQPQNVGEHGRRGPDDVLFQRARAATVRAYAQRLGAQAQHGRFAGRQVDLVLDRRHLLVGVRQGGRLEQIAVGLREQAGQAGAGERRPADVFVIGTLHRFLVGVLVVHAGTVEADVEPAFAVGVVLHRASAEEIEPVEPLVEQQSDSQPPQGDARAVKLHVVIDGDGAVARDRVGRGMRGDKPILALSLDFGDDRTAFGPAWDAVRLTTLKARLSSPYFTQSRYAHMSSLRWGARQRCSRGPPPAASRFSASRFNAEITPLALSKTTAKPSPAAVIVLSSLREVNRFGGGCDDGRC